MLAGLAIFLIWRRKRAISNTIHHELPLQDDYHPAVELPVAEKQTELPSRREVVELHSTSLER
jgi:hypothetical protein